MGSKNIQKRRQNVQKHLFSAVQRIHFQHRGRIGKVLVIQNSSFRQNNAFHAFYVIFPLELASSQIADNQFVPRIEYKILNSRRQVQLWVM